MQNFRALGALPPDPRASGGWGLCPQTPRLRPLGASPPGPPNSPPLRISGYAPVLTLYNNAIRTVFAHYKQANVPRFIDKQYA